MPNRLALGKTQPLRESHLPNARIEVFSSPHNSLGRKMPNQDDVHFHAPVADAIAHLMRAAQKCKNLGNNRSSIILKSAALLLEAEMKTIASGRKNESIITNNDGCFYNYIL